MNDRIWRVGIIRDAYEHIVGLNLKLVSPDYVRYLLYDMIIEDVEDLTKDGFETLVGEVIDLYNNVDTNFMERYLS